MRTILTLLVVTQSVFTFAKKDSLPNRGFCAGLAAGISASNISFLSKNQSGTNLALNWKIGYSFNPRLSVLLNGAVSVYPYNITGRKRKRDYGGLYPSLQYRLNKRFWILGGAGLCTDASVFYDIKPDDETETRYYSGLGAITSVGYILHQHKKTCVDVQARANYGYANTALGNATGLTFAILLGINLY